MSADPRPRPAEPTRETAAPYRRTLFDRHGPDAGVLLRARMYGLATFGLTIPLFGSVVAKFNPQMPRVLAVPLILACSAAAGALAMAFGLGTSLAAGRIFGSFTMGGSSTPYAEQYSREQALVMRGEIDAALRSFEAAIRESPEAIDPRMKAAELYAKEKGDARRASELFREVQRIPTATTGQHIYATNRLVDMYTGPLADPGRALVELRRLIERYPNSPAANHARNALTILKPRLLERREL